MHHTNKVPTEVILSLFQFDVRPLDYVLNIKCHQAAIECHILKFL